MRILKNILMILKVYALILKNGSRIKQGDFLKFFFKLYDIELILKNI